MSEEKEIKTSETVENKKSYKWLILLALGVMTFIGGVIILVIIGIFLAIGATSDEKDMAREFIMLNADGKYSDAYEMTSPAFKENVSIDGLQEVIEGNPILDNATSVSFSTFVTSNGVKTVSGTLIGKDGEESPITVDITCDENEVCGVEFLSIDPEDVPEIAGDDYYDDDDWF